MESLTNFKQRYANYVSLHSTASHTLPTARWQLLLNEEMITPFQRQAVPLCLEKKKELKIRSNNNNKKPRNTGGKELVGGLTRQVRPAHTHTCDSHFAPDCHRHKHTSTTLFPFAQANTYRQWLSIKGSWRGGEGRLSVPGLSSTTDFCVNILVSGGCSNRLGGVTPQRLLS